MSFYHSFSMGEFVVAGHAVHVPRVGRIAVRRKILDLRKASLVKNLLYVLAFSSMCFGCATGSGGQMAIGIEIGEPPAPLAYRVPPMPGPDFVWVEGYWYPQGRRYVWHDGYWTRPPYEGAYWVAPYYVGGRYFPGQWESRRGNLAHDHRWDKDKQRDEHHNPHTKDHKDDRR